MGDIERLVSELRACRTARDGVGAGPFTLACSVDDAASAEEVAAAWSAVRLPGELVELWRHARSARLFEDIDYGHCGVSDSCLRGRAPSGPRANARSVGLTLPPTIVVGEFLGDQELLALAGGGSPGRVVIALPLDPRRDWYQAAQSLGEFLERYLNAAGEKFWEAT